VSYPQPDADKYAVNGYQYFRLNTILSSPGDIYESQQSGHAIALGPDSDISKVAVAYFDDQVPTFMQQTSIGSDRSFVGRIDARNEVTYQPIGRPGRVLFWSDDLFNSQFRPVGFLPNDDLFNRIDPCLDVIQFFSPQQALVPRRNDKSWLIQNVAAPLNLSTYFMLPFYGRRYGLVEITNRSPNLFNWAVSGVNFAISPSGAGALDQVTPIRPLGALASGVQEITKITPETVGMFDYLLLQIKSVAALATTPAPIKVIVSDRNA
jgi:hypothetical protein